MLKRSTLQTWQSNLLAPRLRVPTAGAWRRLEAGEKRINMLQEAFSSQAMQSGEIFVITGARGTGKSKAALAICDLRAMQAVYATEQKERSPLPPEEGQCIIVDPVSAFQPENVKQLIQDYKGVCPIILVDRIPRAFRHIFPDLQQSAKNGEIVLVGLKPPSPGVISGYIKDLLKDYDSVLESSDFVELGKAMEGLSLYQVNQITMDAALSRLQYVQPIDRLCFEQALTNWKRMRNSDGEL